MTAKKDISTSNKIVYVLRIAAGGLLAFIGFIGSGVGIIGILDPVGSKMADDSDPFGAPPPLWQALVITLFFVLLLGLGIWLIAKKSTTTVDSDQNAN